MTRFYTDKKKSRLIVGGFACPVIRSIYDRANHHRRFAIKTDITAKHLLATSMSIILQKNEPRANSTDPSRSIAPTHRTRTRSTSGFLPLPTPRASYAHVSTCTYARVNLTRHQTFRVSTEWIIWAACLLVMETIRGIPNPVYSLSSIGVTIRGREGRERRV